MTDDRTDKDLDDFFAAARARRDPPPAGLVARVLADAEAARRPRGAAGMAGSLFRALGGWPSAAGLVAASVAGLAIGFAMPGTVDGFLPPADEAVLYDLADLLPGYGDFEGIGG